MLNDLLSNVSSRIVATTTDVSAQLLITLGILFTVGGGVLTAIIQRVSNKDEIDGEIIASLQARVESLEKQNAEQAKEMMRLVRQNSEERIQIARLEAEIVSLKKQLAERL